MIKHISKTTFIIALVVLTGCRTYGDYGSEEATYAQIEKINTQFADDLDKARAEKAGLDRVVSQLSDLRGVDEEYAELLEKHESMIAHHAELTGHLKVKKGMLGRLTTSYRDLNRALGYIAAEQEAMKADYDTFVRRLAGMTKSDRGAMSRYEIAPPFYERIRSSLERLSLADAIENRLDM